MKECAEQADRNKKKWTSDNPTRIGNDIVNVISEDYVNHYNSVDGHCYVLQTTDIDARNTNLPPEQETLWDAFQSEAIAICTKHTYIETSIHHCWIFAPDEKTPSCDRCRKFIDERMNR
jgi:hypothetical protein